MICVVPIVDEFMAVLFTGLMAVVAVRCCSCLLARDCAMLRMVGELEVPRPRPGDLGAVLPLPGDTVFAFGVWDTAAPDVGTVLPELLVSLALGPDALPLVVVVPAGGAVLVVVVVPVAGEVMDSGGRASLTDTGTGPVVEGDDAHRGEGVDRGEGVTALEGGVGVLCGRGVMLPGWRWGAGLPGEEWDAGLLGGRCGAGLLGGRWGAELLVGGR